jgi:hypothetical protein
MFVAARWNKVLRPCLRRLDQRLSQQINVVCGQTNPRAEDSRLVPSARMLIGKAVVAKFDRIYHDARKEPPRSHAFPD